MIANLELLSGHMRARGFRVETASWELSASGFCENRSRTDFEATFSDLYRSGRNEEPDAGPQPMVFTASIVAG
jgi:hypothetical protein